MEKLLRILFVMCAIAFVTTATACADDKDDKTGGNDKTTKTGGDYKTVKTPSIFKFEVADAGVTIDTTKDVYKITINPSLLTYVVPWGTGFEASAFMPIFTVTFTDDKQGFIIPTTVDKAEALKTTHASDQETALDTNFNPMDNANDITHSFLADPDANNPVFGFDATELNADWSTLAPRAAVTGIMTDTRVRVGCSTTITGTKAASFTVIAPTDDDDLAIAKGTKTECFFSLVGGNAAAADAADDAADAAADAADAADAAADAAAADVAAIAAATAGAADVAAAVAAADAADAAATAADDAAVAAVAAADAAAVAAAVQMTAYKAWATAAVADAKDDATKNIQKMGFVGIVTGDATASAITKAAEITEDAETLGIKGFTADASAKLVKAYNSVLQKVEIVIAVAK